MAPAAFALNCSHWLHFHLMFCVFTEYLLFSLGLTLVKREG